MQSCGVLRFFSTTVEVWQSRPISLSQQNSFLYGTLVVLSIATVVTVMSIFFRWRCFWISLLLVLSCAADRKCSRLWQNKETLYLGGWHEDILGRRRHNSEQLVNQRPENNCFSVLSALITLRTKARFSSLNLFSISYSVYTSLKTTSRRFVSKEPQWLIC